MGNLNIWNNVRAVTSKQIELQTNPVDLDRKPTVPTEEPPLVDELRAKYFRIEGYIVETGTGLTAVNLRFLDQSRFNQIVPQLSTPGSMDPVSTHSLLLRESGRTWNRTLDLWICSERLWLLHYRWRSQLRTQQRNKTENKKNNGVFWDFAPHGSCKSRHLGGT
jgi:hypothetical protein